MWSRLPWDRIFELFRFYQVAILNTVFGLSTYALLVWFGLNMYAAQLIAHIMGVAFNYFTYSRHVFRAAAPAKLRFMVSYAVNYFVGLMALVAFAQVIASPYVSGVAAALSVSMINFFALKYLVFRARAHGA